MDPFVGSWAFLGPGTILAEPSFSRDCGIP